MKNKIEYMAARIPFAVLFIVLAFALLRMATFSCVKLGLMGNNTFVKAVFFEMNYYIESVISDDEDEERYDIYSLYPFEETKSVAEDSKTESLAKKIDRKLFSKIKKAENKIEDKFLKFIVLKMKLTEIAATYEKIISWYITSDSNNPVQRIRNNEFTIFQRKLSDGEIAKAADNIVKLRDFLESQGTPMVYVQGPEKICAYDKEYADIKDFGNSNADRVIELLEKNNISVLDTRKIIHSGSDSMTSMQKTDFHLSNFYRTDHHWRAETALKLMPEICSFLNEKTGTNIDGAYFSDANNFDFILKEDSFFGTHGKKVTKSKADLEDFVLPVPRDQMDFKYFSYAQYHVKNNISGPYDILLLKGQFDKKDIYGEYGYVTFVHGDINNVIINNREKEGSKILIIGDSYTDPIEAYICQKTSEMHSLDRRNFAASIRSYIKKNGPFDAVMLLYYPGSYSEINDPDHCNLFNYD